MRSKLKKIYRIQTWFCVDKLCRLWGEKNCCTSSASVALGSSCGENGDICDSVGLGSGGTRRVDVARALIDVVGIVELEAVDRERAAHLVRRSLLGLDRVFICADGGGGGGHLTSAQVENGRGHGLALPIDLPHQVEHVQVRAATPQTHALAHLCRVVGPSRLLAIIDEFQHYLTQCHFCFLFFREISFLITHSQ